MAPATTPLPQNVLPPRVLSPGKIAAVLDAGYGSSSKGLVSAWITKNERPDFLLTANGRNSSHTVVDNSLKASREAMTPCQLKGEFVFKVLPVGAFYNKWKGYNPIIYIGPGAAFTVEDLVKEMKACELDKTQVWVHPLASVVTEADIGYENGTWDFDGNPRPQIDHDSGTTKHGTTGSGVGAARAKKSLRKGKQWYDVSDQPTMGQSGLMFADTFEEAVLKRLALGKTGLLDGSQGYLLSLYGKFFPHCTSRPVTLASFFADINLPVSVIGNVCAVARTFPIRIASVRYFLDNQPVTLAEKVEAESRGLFVNTVDSNSGGWYQDQRELTWEQVSEQAGRHIEPQLTSLTKLPRRIATWSKAAIRDFLLHNAPPCGCKTYLFVTFTNYLKGSEMKHWMHQNIHELDDAVTEVLLSDSPETDSVLPLVRDFE